VSSDTANNIFQRPILRQTVNQGSRVAVCIGLFCVDQDGKLQKVSTGSGFFHTRNGRSYFITNWHVITGRDPENPARLINGHPESPTAFQLNLPRKDNPDHYVPSRHMPLYDDGNPMWVETGLPNAEGKIDLVAIEIHFPPSDDASLVTPVERFAPTGNSHLYIGRDLAIVGYPFGISDANPYPIWKRGSIGSEPAILIGGMPKFYIDSPGRPGMSGAPIFMIARGNNLPSDMANLINSADTSNALETIMQLDVDVLKNADETLILEFAGVYSGSVGDKNLEQLQVGVAWHGGMVDRLFTHQQIGSNPYPPDHD
jgi:hypothetical protein